MSKFAPRQWAPDEKPMLPGSPSTPAHPTPLRFAYLAVGILITITGGLGNALVSVNLINLQGVLGAYSTETAWLPAVYVMTNASMNLLLVKFRQQFGLRLFTEIFLVLYALVTFAHLFVNDLGSAIAVRAAHGMLAAAVSPLGLYYVLQAFKKEWRLRGVALAMGCAQLALPLAYIFSNDLLQIAEWRGLYMFELGLALVSLGAVLLLKLPPGDYFKAFRPMDFVTFALFAPGMALLCAAVSFGRVRWWFEEPWIGIALAASVFLLAAALCVEHNRANPLLNLRWFTSGNIVRLALSMILVRIVLSEQSVGAVGFLRLVGLDNDQLQTLYAIVLCATIAGVVVSALTINVNHLMAPQVISLLLMALGAWIDAHATNQTRPEQMYLSQSLLAFGGTLFLGPLVISLIGTVIANPANLISFSVLFGLTQNLGGLLGSAIVGSFQILREKYHSSIIVEHLSSLDPLVASRIQAGAAAVGQMVADPAARARQGAASLAASATREANILAYNDVFLVLSVLAAASALWIFLHAVWLHYFPALTPVPASPPPGAPPPPEPVTD
ncbi:MFS transporter [Massilia sp. IC2-476]|uniref:MFS transporter n=1 Tax=Massilia sp. IC2-476 TaxID=2887199 RepID=UPI001D0FBE64|nr:MFS transporter [Massilia sp. IC2-476]MCC2970426.1 MFS transporter [Massilia sp. IC2-476]